MSCYMYNYADNTVIFAKSENDLISTLSLFIDHCKIWNLNINVENIIIMVFGDSMRQSRNIVVQNMQLEVVKHLNTLGLYFPKQQTFFLLPNNTGNTVVPILLYDCEVWGYEDLHLIEKVHTNFMKHILSVKKTTPMLCCMAILYAFL